MKYTWYTPPGRHGHDVNITGQYTGKVPCVVVCKINYTDMAEALTRDEITRRQVS